MRIWKTAVALALLFGAGLMLRMNPDRVQAAAKPNVVVILADDQRADYLGVAGHPFVKTPNIDALAADGVYFRNAFATTSSCTPSRTTILMGEFERKHGVTFTSYSALTREAFLRSYPMQLKNAGYFTGYVGKNHTPAGKTEKGFGYKSGLMEEEFDYWYGNHGHSTFYPKTRHSIYNNAKADTQPEIFTEGALDFLRRNPEFAGASGFLRERPKDRPFCLLVNFNVPHGAGTGSMKLLPSDPELYRTAYRDQIDKMPQPATYIAERDLKERKIPEHVYNGVYISQYDYVKTAETLRERQVRTCQTVTGIDNLVGAVVAELKRQGLAENTIIIYSADHGLQHGEHGLGGKCLLYEESIRIPLVVYDPRLPAKLRGRKLDQMVATIDFAPTILDLTGVGPLPSMQGRSWKPLLYGEPIKWRDELFFENMFMGQNYPRIEAVRDSRYKYIRYFDKKKDRHHFYSHMASIQGEKPIFEELYDMRSDPTEVTNLAENSEYAKILASYRGRCQKAVIAAKGGDGPPDTFVEHLDDPPDKLFGWDRHLDQNRSDLPGE